MIRRSTWLRAGDVPGICHIGSWAIPEKLLDAIDSNWSVCSVGAANDISFDVGLAEIADVRVHIVDPTPMAVNHFQRALEVLKKKSTFAEEEQPTGEQSKDYFDSMENSFLHTENLVLVEEALSTTNAKTQRFYKLDGKAGSNETYFTLEPTLYSKEYIDVAASTLESLAERYGNRMGFDILKVDIEGFEIEVLNHMVDRAHLKPALLLVDHDGARLGRLEETISLMKRLEEYGYLICYNRNWDAIYVRHDFASVFGCQETCALGCGKAGDDIDPYSEKPWDALSYVHSVNQH
jgi:FkbM family methyltransferase